MNQITSQLPLAENSPGSHAEPGSSVDDPIAALEHVSTDLRKALPPLRNLRNLAKEPMTNAAKIRALVPRAKRALTKLPAEITAKVESWMVLLTKTLDDAEAELARSFTVDLDQRLRALNVTLGGNLPLLEASFFKLEVRQQDVRVWFGPQRESIGTVPKSATAVATYIEQLRTQLTAEPFDDERFVAQLYQAYRAVLAADDSLSPTQAHINAVHRQLIVARQEPGFTQTQKLRTYTRMQLGYDLYRLTQHKQRGKELQLVTAPRSQTIKPIDSLWVPSDEAGRGFLYSHLTFRED